MAMLACGGFKNLARAPAAPYERTPWLDVANDLNDIVVAVEESGVYRKTHEKRMDAIASFYEKSFVRT